MISQRRLFSIYRAASSCQFTITAKTNVSLMSWSFFFAVYRRSSGHGQCACSARSFVLLGLCDPAADTWQLLWLSADSSLLCCTYAPLWLWRASMHSFLKQAHLYSLGLSRRDPLKCSNTWYWCSWGHSNGMCTMWYRLAWKVRCFGSPCLQEYIICPGRPRDIASFIFSTVLELSDVYKSTLGLLGSSNDNVD